MNDKKINPSEGDSRNRLVRLIGIIVGVVVIVMIAKSLLSSDSDVIDSGPAAAQVRSLPEIESLPGVGSASDEYVALQNKQNQISAQDAAKSGGSSLPTITRSTLKKSNLPKADQEILAKNQSSCSVDELKKARDAGVNAFELRCRGCSAQALKEAGFTAGELRAAGFTAAELKAAGFSARELREAGFSAADLLKAGFKAAELAVAGFDAEDLKLAGVSAQDLLDAGFSPEQLRAAGFTVEELKKAGLSVSELLAAGFTPKAIAASGFSVDDLRRAQVSSADLAKAGLIASKSVDCSIEDLKAARARGVQAKTLQARGCSAKALRAAGFTAGELKDAGFSAADLHDAGFSASDLKSAGFSVADLKKAGFSAKDLKEAGFSLSDLKSAGYSATDLKKAGFSARDLKDAGFSAQDLRSAGFFADELKAAGFSAKDLKDAGFSAADLVKSGFSPADLKKAGFSAKQLRGAGVSPKELELAGYSSDDLAEAGFTRGDLVRAGYSNSEIAASELDNYGVVCTVDSAKESKKQGVSIAALKRQGCTASVLQAAGFSVKEELAAGFSAKDLNLSGIKLRDLLASGISVADLVKAGFGKADLINAGVNKDLLDSMGVKNSDTRKTCQIEEIEKQMRSGVPANKFKDAGCSVASLLAAGYSPEDLRKAGYTMTDLKQAGVSDKDLIAAGFKLTKDKKSDDLSEDLLTQIAAALEKPETQKSQASQQLDSLRSRQSKLMEQHRKTQDLADRAQAMSGQASALLQGWTRPPVQQLQNAPFNEKEINGASLSNNMKGGYVGPNAEVIKAGSILYAVIDTAINSDNPGPVLATVVEGHLKGAKIIGAFVRQDETLLISFNRISIPGMNRSMQFSAIAVDQNTSRTALATHVDRHTWLRYGALFASSFLEGIGQAVSNSGAALSVGTGGAWEVVRNDLSYTDQVIASLGTVGERFGNALSSNFSKPPTVRVASGSGVGILFMNDFAFDGSFGNNEGADYVR